MNRSSPQTQDLFGDWQAQLSPYACGGCQGVFLIPSGKSTSFCPFCYKEDLMPLGQEIVADQELYTRAPEGILHPQLLEKHFEEAFDRFREEIPFSSKDLQKKYFLQRMSLMYLPHWWVDAPVKAKWNAEMGFDYQVVSHQEYNVNGQWKTKEQVRTQTRWEERIGTLDRVYKNISTPALEKWEAIKQAIGGFSLNEASDFQSVPSSTIAFQLPSIVPKDAWPNAEFNFHRQAATECKAASGAQHIRMYHWSPEFGTQHWTQVVVPVYTTFYEDDEQKKQPVLIHGLTGKITGRKKASVRKARRTALTVGLLGLVCLIAAFAALYHSATLPMEALIGGGVILGLGIGAFSFTRVPMAKSFNTAQEDKDIWIF